MSITQPDAGITPLSSSPKAERRPILMLLLRTIAKYNFVDDVAQYCFALAVAVSTYLPGDPLWGMIVRAASGGKTEAIRLVELAADQHVDSSTEPALLSWHKPNPKATRSDPTGILIRIGNIGFVTIADFSTVLSGRYEMKDALFGALRRVFDGEYQRDLGNEPVPLQWKGRLTLLAACTNAIDNYASHADALGPRWVYLRLSERNEQARRRVLRVARDADKNAPNKAVAQKLARSLVWAGGESVEGIELSPEAGDAVDDAAVLAAYGRGVVPRDSYRREVDGPLQIEEPTRIAKQLGALCRCLMAIGLIEGEAVALMSRVALDSMPEMRAKVLRMLPDSGGVVIANQIATKLRWDQKTASRCLEDLSYLGFLERQSEEPSSSWPNAGQGAAQTKPWLVVTERLELVSRVRERSMGALLEELAGQA